MALLCFTVLDAVVATAVDVARKTWPTLSSRLLIAVERCLDINKGQCVQNLFH